MWRCAAFSLCLHTFIQFFNKNNLSSLSSVKKKLYNLDFWNFFLHSHKRYSKHIFYWPFTKHIHRSRKYTISIWIDCKASINFKSETKTVNFKVDFRNVCLQKYMYMNTRGKEIEGDEDSIFWNMVSPINICSLYQNVHLKKKF